MMPRRVQTAGRRPENAREDPKLMVLPIRNLLLETYRKQSGVDLASRFERVVLPFRTLLYDANMPPRHVHLITAGAASLVTTMQDGELIEVGFTGSEGFPESLFLLGPQTTARKCVVQVEGTALRMRFKDFQDLLARDPLLNRLVSRWIQYESLALGQIAACNGLHEVEERLARWLLMVQDRVGDSHVKLTQDLLGQMLGARRSTVTLAAGHLQRAGLIEYRRGHIWIHSREDLEKAACECYAVMRNLYDNLYT